MANEPVRSSTDKPLPLGATIAIGALALLGALTLVGWVFSALMGIVKFALIVVVVIALISWLAGRRLDR